MKEILQILIWIPWINIFTFGIINVIFYVFFLNIKNNESLPIFWLIWENACILAALVYLYFVDTSSEKAWIPIIMFLFVVIPNFFITWITYNKAHNIIINKQHKILDDDSKNE